jgi:uncharacterized OB-fold protein
MENDIIQESQEPEYQAFLKEGKIRFQKCAQCATVRHPARWICPECLSEDWEWTEVSGRGEIESLVWYNEPFDRHFTRTPYNVAVVRLVEGPRIVTNILGVAPGEPEVGDAVSLVIDEGSLLNCQLSVTKASAA